MKLRTYLNDHRITTAAFGRAAGVRLRSTMQRIVNRGAIPRPDLMRKIYVLTNGVVTPNDFYDLPELATADSGLGDSPCEEAA